jgi:DNA invertase Pin-like site-specific DNA recombinase
MMMQMVGSFAEFARSMLRERTMAGLQTAMNVGRRLKLTQQQLKEIVKMVELGDKSAADVAKLFGVHRSTVGQLLARQG